MFVGCFNSLKHFECTIMAWDTLHRHSRAADRKLCSRLTYHFVLPSNEDILLLLLMTFLMGPSHVKYFKTNHLSFHSLLHCYLVLACISWCLNYRTHTISQILVVKSHTVWFYFPNRLWNDVETEPFPVICCGFLHLPPLATGADFTDGDWVRYWSMSMGKYH